MWMFTKSFTLVSLSNPEILQIRLFDNPETHSDVLFIPTCTESVNLLPLVVPETLQKNPFDNMDAQSSFNLLGKSHAQNPLKIST